MFIKTVSCMPPGASRGEIRSDKANQVMLGSRPDSLILPLRLDLSPLLDLAIRMVPARAILQGIAEEGWLGGRHQVFQSCCLHPQTLQC